MTAEPNSRAAAPELTPLKTRPHRAFLSEGERSLACSSNVDTLIWGCPATKNRQQLQPGSSKLKSNASGQRRSQHLQGSRHHVLNRNGCDAVRLENNASVFTRA